jgi:hypothetical protein
VNGVHGAISQKMATFIIIAARASNPKSRIVNLFTIFSFQTVSVVQWSEFLAVDPEVQVRYPALSDFLRSSRSGTGSTQPREYN